MLYSRRFLLLALAAVPACGFTPAYGPGGAAHGLRGAITVDAPNDEEGYHLVRRLEERLGAPTTGAYRLSASIAIGQDGLGITPDQDITRYRIRGELTWALRHLASDEIVADGRVRNFTAYSAPVFDDTRGSIAGNTVSVLTAERDARERLMIILADQLVARLIATAPDWQR
ncbi:LPS assembly lipoprotein LptE [Oceaniglobus ichthyenteri]|uniref:LPS assembly lipoprotein LptE n=1 Tax=Oceaniglobus ichthyenteri TaxID=2136177 RepID=UPI000D396E49|nr:LPS assembly lipoprotein LptE [Oceaniglobus ichthyenteri]